MEAVIDGATLRLAGGMEVRLADLDAGAAAEPGAAEGLSERALGREVELRYGAVDRDRYGRAVAHVFPLGAERSLQQEVLAAGLGMVSSLAADRACVAELLAEEAAARSGAAGRWARTGAFSAYGDAVQGIDGAFALVEGRIVSVGRRERTVYLNFGHDWSTDFTVSMTLANTERIEAEGGSFDTLVGVRVRIRGWLTQRDGPWIAVDHPEQIEILDEAP